MKIRLFRYWSYIRMGYNNYISFPIGILNFLTIMFYLLLERIPILKTIFPHFIIFALITLIIGTPLSAFAGWLHYSRTRIYATEAILAAECNPQTVFIQAVGMRQWINFLEHANVPIMPEYRLLCEYWEKLNAELRWQPNI